jgi:hypothetical protein
LARTWWGWRTFLLDRATCYVFMTNHVHQLVTPDREDSLPRSVQSLGRRHVRTIDTAYRWTGTLSERRTRVAPIDSETYFLACCRYVELKAARACMIRHPRDYRWSSFRAHADGRTDPWSAITRFTGRSAAVRRHVKAPTACCFAAHSKAASSTRYVPRPTVDGLWALHSSQRR